MSPLSGCISSSDESSSHDDAIKALAFEDLYDEIPPTPEGRVLYISRHGESLYNLENRIGGNPGLSPQGLRYARALGAYVNELALDDLKVWMSELQRTHQTSQHIRAPKEIVPELNEIDSGELDDYTYKDFEKLFPKWFRERENNKLTFRYPGGESYRDVCRRLDRVLPLMDQSHNQLVVSHQAVIRCILAFLLKLPEEEVPYIKVPLHCILKVTFCDGKNLIEYHHMPIECVDTYRPKVAKETKKSSSKTAPTPTPTPTQPPVVALSTKKPPSKTSCAKEFERASLERLLEGCEGIIF